MQAIERRELAAASLRLSRKLAVDPWEVDDRPCCASCGAAFDETGVDFEVDVVFCNQCSTFEGDEDCCEPGGEG